MSQCYRTVDYCGRHRRSDFFLDATTTTTGDITGAATPQFFFSPLTDPTGISLLSHILYYRFLPASIPATN